MDLERYSAATIVQSVRTKNGFVQCAVKLPLAVHNALARVTYLRRDTLSHLNQHVIHLTSPDVFMQFDKDARIVNIYLTYNAQTSTDEPTADDVRRVLSEAYHLLNVDDRDGADSRQAIIKALDVLGLGEPNPERSRGYQQQSRPIKR